MLGKRARRTPEQFESLPGWQENPTGANAGVGLGIVAALEKRSGSENVTGKVAMVSPETPGAAPLPMVGGRAPWKSSVEGLFCEVDEDVDASWFHTRNLGSPSPHLRRGPVETSFSKTADFLGSCYLCKRILHGVDIYMYRGDKAFCSMECRGQQMVVEQIQERCSP